MPDLTTDPLGQASGLLLANRHSDARAVLAAFLRTNPTSDQAWYLMSHAVSDTAQQQDCLDRALHLNPNNLAARERLALLRGGQTPPPLSGPAAPSIYRDPEPPASIYRPPEPPVYSSQMAWPPPASAHQPDDPVPPTPNMLGQLRGQLIQPGAALEPPAEKPPRARDWPMYFLGGFALLALVALLATAAVFLARAKPTPVAVVVIPNTAVSFPYPAAHVDRHRQAAGHGYALAIPRARPAHRPRLRCRTLPKPRRWTKSPSRWPTCAGWRSRACPTAI